MKQSAPQSVSFDRLNGLSSLRNHLEENVGMSLKGNLKAKIKIDKLFHSLVSTIKEPPGKAVA